MADVAEASRKREQELKKIILAWMNKKGFKNTAAAYEKDQDIHGSETLEQLAFRKGLEPDFCIRDQILQWGMEDAKPTRYEESYVELREWTQSLSEDIKEELSELLYPLFVHCFLELVAKQYTAEARELLSHQRHHHEPERSEEITCLAGITEASQLESNPVAVRYLRGDKLRVLLCDESDRRLTEYLHNHRHHGLLRLLSQRLELAVYGATPADLPPTLPAHPDKKRPRQWWGELPPAPRQRRAEEEGGGGGEGAGAEEAGAVVEGRVGLSAGAAPSVCCFTLVNGRELGGSETTVSVDVSGDGKAAAGGMQDGSLRICAATPTGGGQSVWTQRRERGGVEGGGGHVGAVYGTGMSRDGRFVLSSGQDCTAKLWRVGGEGSVATYRGHAYPVWACALAPLQGVFATASYDRTARLWTTDRLHPLRILAGHLASVDALAFHPNSAYLATGSADKTCRLWDSASGDCLRLFKGHRAPVTSVSVSRCGRLLASGCAAGEVLLWDVASSRCLATLTGHEGCIHSLDFSGGGGPRSLLASAGQDGCVKLWEVGGSMEGGGSEIKSIKTEHQRLLRVRFARANLLYAAGSA